MNPILSVDHTKVPGTVIAHSPQSTECYLGSPSIVILPYGDYIAKLDVFGPKTNGDTTQVFSASDRGKTWKKRAEIVGQFWSTLFVHEKSLYLIGTNKRFGDVTIRKSLDGGMTWTTPSESSSGRLLSGGYFHCAPVPVLQHSSRLWMALEKHEPHEGWCWNMQPFVISAPIEANLLDASNWTVSEFYPIFNQSWRSLLVTEKEKENSRAQEHPNFMTTSGWLEGNVVATPNGEVVNILRVQEPYKGRSAAIVHVSPDGKSLTFDPENDFINFPGGCVKFTIRFDPISKLYWSLTNWIHPNDEGKNAERTRNTLALTGSPDLRDWTVRSIILRHPDSINTGFQYVDWVFDDNDIIAASRTAFDDGLGGPDNSHNANFLTFHRIENFRNRSLTI
jgi:hypothetical protein